MAAWHCGVVAATGEAIVVVVAVVVEGTAGLAARQPSLQKSSFKTFGEELVELPRTSH